MHGHVDAFEPRDVGFDSPDLGPDDPQWVRIEDLPRSCPFARARHPERIHAVDFAPCGDGCTRGAVDGYVADRALGGVSDGSWYAVVGVRAAGWSGPALVLLRDDGVVAAAFGVPSAVSDGTYCLLSALAVRDGYVAFEIGWVCTSFGGACLDSGLEWRIYFARLSEIATVADPVVRSVDRPIGLLDVSRHGVLTVQDDHIEALIDGAPLAIDAQSPMVLVSDSVFGLSWDGMVTTPTWFRPGQAAAHGPTIAPATRPNWLATDDADFVWMAPEWDSTGSFLPGLWHARTTSDPAAFAPMRVPVTVHDDLVTLTEEVRVNDGRVATLVRADTWSSTAVRVTTLATGAVQEWPLPGAPTRASVIGVNETDVIVDVRGTEQAIYRVALATLPVRR